MYNHTGGFGQLNAEKDKGGLYRKEWLSYQEGIGHEEII
jgi:hypothetical protein